MKICPTCKTRPRHKKLSYCLICNSANTTNYRKTHPRIARKLYKKASEKKKLGWSVGTWLLNKIKKSGASQAKRGGHKINVTAEYLDSIYTGRCYYTGVVLEDRRLTGNVGSHPLVPSVDRVDSSKGYEPGNVVICALGINRMKNNTPEPEFVAVLSKIADSMFGKMWSKAA